MISNLDEATVRKIEKRRSVRVPVEFTALIQHDRKLYSGLALNLSEDGLFLVVPELLSPSQTVDVTFRLPNSADETKVPAKVAWCSKVKGRGKFIYGVGVQITNNGAKGTLHAFVESLLQKTAVQEEPISQ